MHTREKTLQEALRLFSEKGYEAVSVRDIARAVGVKESSLYNHFRNKQDIFDSILAEYSHRGAEFFRQYELTGEDDSFTADSRTVEVYRHMSGEQLAAMAGRIFEFYFTDEINTRLRRMLTIEQYRSPESARLYRKLSFDDSLEYQTKLFEEMIKAGCFRQADPYTLALAFYAPIYLIFCKFDNGGSVAEARELFERHVRHFSDTYTIS
jgi:AcrR family transcriptional regulator